MIKLLTILFLLSGIGLAQAQDSSKTNGVYVFTGFMPTLYNSKLTFLSQAGLVSYFSKDFKSGFVVTSMTIQNIKKDFYDPNTNTRPYIESTDFQALLEWEMIENDNRVISIGFLPALSYLSLDNTVREIETENGFEDYVPEYGDKWYFILEPKINYTYKLTRYLHIGFGFSYRYSILDDMQVNGIENAVITSEDLSGISSNVHLKFGIFEN